MDCIEKIDARINVEEILRSIENLCTRYPSYQRSEAVGGWSVQSIYGSYTEGWPKVFCPYNGPNNMAPTWNPLNEYEKSLGSIQDFVNPTEFYSEPLWGLIKKIDAMGFNPRRARVIKLSAGASSVWHIDGSKKYYQVRLHLPLLTSSQCFFETDKGSYHMPADGSFYIVKINQNHRVVNHGSTDRLHFVSHIWDTNHTTKFHKYISNENIGESIHPQEGQWW